MKQRTRSIMSQWIFWTPLKFALTSFFMTTLAIVISLLLAHILTISGTQITIILLTISAFIYSLIHTFKKLPKLKLDQYNYIALNNSIIIAAYIFFTVVAILNLVSIEVILQKTLFCQIVFLFLGGITILYLLGLMALGIYTQYLRVRELGISKWKALCSLPFGFGMLSTAGYLLNDTKKSKKEQITESKWYSKLTDWITASDTNTVITFIFITLFNGIIIGFGTILWTLTYLLVFAIWTLKVGRKQLMKNIGKGYSTLAIAINIVSIIAFISLTILAAQQIALYA